MNIQRHVTGGLNYNMFKCRALLSSDQHLKSSYAIRLHLVLNDNYNFCIYASFINQNKSFLSLVYLSRTEGAVGKRMCDRIVAYKLKFKWFNKITRII